MSVVPSRPAHSVAEALVHVFVSHDLGAVHPKKQRERRAERLKLLALDMSSVGTSNN